MSMPSDCDPQVIQAIQHALEAPVGPERYSRAEAALDVAVAAGGFDNEFWARKTLVEAAYYVPGDPSLLTHYGWLRRALDTAGERLDDEDRISVLWLLKWAMTLVHRLPQVPLQTVIDTIEDVGAALARHGYTLRPVHEHRAMVAESLGQAPLVQEHLAAWARTPRDRLSDCHACENRSRARLTLPFDSAAALELLGPTLRGELSCGDEPQFSLALGAEIHAGRGEWEQSASCYRRGWPLVRGDRKFADSIGRHLVALTRMGNVDRALTHLGEVLDWIPEYALLEDRAALAGAGAFVLDVATERGLSLEALGAAAAHELRAQLHAQADEVAAIFDRRNGSDMHARWLAERLDATGVRPEPTLPPLAVAAVPDAAPRSDPPPRPHSIGALAQALRSERDALGEGYEDLAAQWLGYRQELIATATDSDWRDVGWLEWLTGSSLAEGDDEALAQAETAADRAGDEVLRRLVQIDRLTRVIGAAEPEAGRAAYEQAVALAEQILALGEPAEAAAAYRMIGRALPDERGEAPARRAIELHPAGGSTLRAALYRLELAHRVMGSDPDLALTLVDQARGLAAPAGHPTLLAMAGEVGGRLAAQRGEFEDAIVRIRAGLTAGAGPRAEAPLRGLLADIGVDRQDWPLVIEQGHGLIELARRTGDQRLLAIGQRHLGLGLVESGQPAEAAPLLEAALTRARHDLPDLVAPIGWAPGNALSASGEPGAARTAFATAATSFEAEGRIQELAHAHQRAGDCGWDAEDLPAARAHYEAAVEHSRSSGLVAVFVSAARSLAALTATTEDPSAGLAALDAVPAQALALAREHDHEDADAWPDWLRMPIGRQGAALLVGVGDSAAAATRLATLQTHLEQAGTPAGDPQLAIVRAERAAALAEAGQFEAAAELLEASLPMLTDPDLSGLRRQCAGRYAQALYDAGQVEAADEVWERFGS